MNKILNFNKFIKKIDMKNSLFLYLISIYLLNIEAKFPSDFSWGVSTSAY